MAPIRTIKQFHRAPVLAALFALLAQLPACSDLDPVKVESKCDGPGPIDERCPQCQIPQFASECPQCQQSGPDEGTCLPPGVPWTEPQTEEGNVSVLPDAGIVENEGGQASPDGSTPGDSPDSSNNNPSKPSNNGGKPGSSDSRPAGGSGGSGSSSNDPMAMAGSMAPTRGPSGCVDDTGCKKPGFPACGADGACLECVTDIHCPDGMQCNAVNDCVGCVDNTPCTPQGKVCFTAGR
jgi:hypothetical protein